MNTGKMGLGVCICGTIGNSIQVKFMVTKDHEGDLHGWGYVRDHRGYHPMAIRETCLHEFGERCAFVLTVRSTEIVGDNILVLSCRGRNPWIEQDLESSELDCSWMQYAEDFENAGNVVDGGTNRLEVVPMTSLLPLASL